MKRTGLDRSKLIRKGTPTSTGTRTCPKAKGTPAKVKRTGPLGNVTAAKVTEQYQNSTKLMGKKTPVICKNNKTRL